MDYLLYLLILYTLITGITDLIYGKVHNIVSLVVFLLAVLIKIFYAGDFLTSLLSAIICFMCFLPLFYFSIIGGGDAKMMFVLGYIVGYHKAVDTVLLSFMASALFAVIVVIIDGRYKIFFERLKAFLISLIYPGVKPILPTVHESLKAPVAFALGISAIITYTNTWVGLLK